ncbi:MAG: alkaline phosphatase PhoX, partial [Acidobacteriota bacterium]
MTAHEHDQETEIASPCADPHVDRRRFLQYVGVGAGYLVGASAFGGALSQIGCAAPGRAWVRSDGRPTWTPPPYPVPLIADDAPRESDRERLATFDVVDDVVLPEGFRYDILAQWGDVFGADGHRIRFGINNDYTGLVKIDGTTDDYWMIVNHEYITGRPFLQAYEEIFGEAPPVLLLEEDTR